MGQSTGSPGHTGCTAGRQAGPPGGVTGTLNSGTKHKHCTLGCSAVLGGIRHGCAETLAEQFGGGGGLREAGLNRQRLSGAGGGGGSGRTLSSIISS